MPPQDDDGDSAGRGAQLASAGARIGAAAAGGLLSSVMGPEAGAAAGQTLGELSEPVIRQVLERRPQERAIRVLQTVAEQVGLRRAAGEEPRRQIADADSADAVTIFEAVVDAAVRSFEQKKEDAIANLYLAFAFEDSVSPSDALLFVRRVQEASWRQLVLMRYFEDMAREQERLALEASIGEAEVGVRGTLVDELAEMFRTLGLLGYEKTPLDGVDTPTNIDGRNGAAYSVGKIRLTRLGLEVSRLARLSDLVGEPELDEIAADFSIEHDADPPTA